MPALLKFRTMQLADIDAVIKIESELKHPWSKQMLSDCLQANYHCSVAVIDDVMVGYAILMFAADEAEILNIVIASQYRGCGYGKLLLQNLIKTAQDKNAKKIFLEVRVSNSAAIKLYEFSGFERINIRKNYYKSLQGFEDAAVYSRCIL